MLDTFHMARYPSLTCQFTTYILLLFIFYHSFCRPFLAKATIVKVSRPTNAREMVEINIKTYLWLRRCGV